ncbi:cytochrome P450 [Dactylonectria macrodidyma]|uniref:Cytochrome P450 n=1 Tax=Dactylonectria macrodidyma TaxID=307937 RepID=A0A9P9JKQ7_9HYPO|nr:cytochrome P450 [Dactylonectria macrodidyma]
MDVLSSLDPDSPTAYAAAFGLGIFLHVALFRFGDWDLWVPRLIFITTTLFGALVYSLVFYLDYDTIYDASLSVSKLFVALAGGIYTSVAAYRLLFHPLRRFPGPFLSGLTSLYPTYLLVRRFHQFEEVQELHRKYGDIVRIGPSELSIANVNALHAIHSAQSPCLKGPWYNIFHPMHSVQSTRDVKEHARRRKIWDRGFGPKALRNYEPRVAQYTDLLLSRIQENAGKSMDASRWSNYYGFDVMGDLAFGKSFDMLKAGVAHSHMKLMHEATVFGTSFGRFPWAFILTQSIPIVNIQWKKYVKWLTNQVKARAAAEPKLPDVFSWVLEAYNTISNPSDQDKMHLLGDANLIVVAGSDTTSASITCTLFELATHPEICKSLQAELDEYFAVNTAAEHMTLSKLKYLQAVIDEGMRLHPAVPSGVQRMTPPQGLTIDGTFIPGNAIVQIPPYTLFRDPRYFGRPDEFLPERWTTQPELVTDGSAFVPFSMGKYSCVGKQLGLMEIRFVISQVLHRYDITLAPGQTADAFLEGIVDGFTLMCPKLEMVFTPRRV